MVFKGTTGMCESICLQMNQRDRVFCEFEMDFKKSFCRRSNVSNDDIISYRPGPSCSKGGQHYPQDKSVNPLDSPIGFANTGQ